jgi:hypothetical protein
MNPKQIAELAKNHWREEYPEGYQTLVNEGRLEKEAHAAAKLTLAEMKAQMAAGLSEQDAWEASRHLFVLTDPILPP